MCCFMQMCSTYSSIHNQAALFWHYLGAVYCIDLFKLLNDGSLCVSCCSTRKYTWTKAVARATQWQWEVLFRYKYLQSYIPWKVLHCWLQQQNLIVYFALMAAWAWLPETKQRKVSNKVHFTARMFRRNVINGSYIYFWVFGAEELAIICAHVHFSHWI